MKLILLFVLSINLSSCFKFQYLTVDSKQTTKNEQKELVAENDTVKVSYRFFNYGSLTIFVFNKSSSPLEVNWQKSSFILNNNSTSYYSPDLSINGAVKIDSAYSIIRETKYTGDINGTIKANDI